MMLKQGKEFLHRDGFEIYHLLITNVIKDPQGTILKITCTTLDYFRNSADFTEDVFQGLLPCITNTELFTMYVNWSNFFRQGPHQDLAYAEQVRQSILSTIKSRGLVKEGDGKLENFDRNCFHKLIHNIL